MSTASDNRDNSTDRQRFRTAAATLAAAVLLCGCGSSPPVRYFTLQGPATVPEAATQTAAALAAAAARSVQFTVITLPEAVDRPQLVLRTGENVLSVNEHARWAEPLRSAFALVLAAEMRAALGGAPVLVRAAGTDDAAWKLSVDVQRFEARAGRGAVIEAVWSLRRKDGTKALARSSSITEAANGEALETLVAAQSRAVATLAREIARTVDEQSR